MIKAILFFVVAFWALMGFLGLLYCKADRVNYFMIIFFILVPIIGLLGGLAHI